MRFYWTKNFKTRLQSLKSMKFLLFKRDKDATFFISWFPMEQI